MEIPTRNILMSKRHYGQVVKIFALGYKDRGFGSPHVHVCTKEEFKRPRLNGGKKLFFLDLIYEGQKKAERFCYYKINEMGKFFLSVWRISLPVCDRGCRAQSWSQETGSTPEAFPQ